MTRVEAEALLAEVLTRPLILTWTETSAENPLWSHGQETRTTEVRWMKTGAYLRRRVSRTRAGEPTPICWETRHRPDWLALYLERPHLTSARTAWLKRGRIPTPTVAEPPA